MSHWKSAKLDLKCSLAVLKRALINIMPEWEQYMKTSENSDITIHNSYTKEDRGGYSLSVAEAAPGVNYADIGFKRDKDGSWATDIDEAYLRLPSGTNTLAGALKRELGIMKAKAQAAKMRAKMVSEQQVGNTKRLIIDIPVADKYKKVTA